MELDYSRQKDKDAIGKMKYHEFITRIKNWINKKTLKIKLNNKNQYLKNISNQQINSLWDLKIKIIFVMKNMTSFISYINLKSDYFYWIENNNESKRKMDTLLLLNNVELSFLI